MRSFTQNPKILAIIDLVERQLGYPIQLSLLSAAEFRMMTGGVQRRSGMWTFLHYPGHTYTDATLCHELMHISLHIEGWPILQTLVELQKYEDMDFILLLAGTLFEHLEVWRRGILLGLPETSLWDAEIETLIQKMTHGVFGRSATPALQELHQALCLTQALLSPASRASRRRLSQSARKNLPRALERADCFCHIYNKHRQGYPHSAEIASQEILGAAKAEIPPGALRFEFPATSSPDLFAQIQAYVT